MGVVRPRLRWVVAAAVAVTACKTKAKEVDISRIIINAPAEFDEALIERDRIRAKLTDRLQQDDSVGEVGISSQQASHQLQIRVHPKMVKDGEIVRPVEVQLKSLGSEPGYETIARGPLQGGLDDVVMGAFDDAWAVLSTLRWLDGQKERQLLQALDDEDLRVRAFAIERLGDRQSKAAVKTLCERLSSERDEEQVMRVVGALVAIGDEQAVGPLIDITYQKDPGFTLQIIFAVSSLGGRTAEGYLVTLASGHPHPEVRRGAQDALGELRKRASRKKPAGG